MKKHDKGVEQFHLTKFEAYSKESLIKIILEQIAVQHEHEIQSDLLMDLVNRYVNKSDELKEKIDEIEKLSITDSLTQAYNRIYFNRALEEEFIRYQRYKHSFALIMFDIDHFKKVNDTYGHMVGDLVLIELVQLVKRTIRSVDVLARWGGEEFILIVLESDVYKAKDLAERIRQKTMENNFPEIGRLTCSFGVTSIKEGDSLMDINKRVDDALYEAKNTGRNRVVIH